jgi:NADPH:quinone reductase-like Zn-dependent oxidoreductase
MDRHRHPNRSAGKRTHEGQWSRLAGNLKSFFVSPFISQKFVFYIAQLNKPDLQVLRELMESGKVAPVIDRQYKMSEARAALSYLEQGPARGKVVLSAE